MNSTAVKLATYDDILELPEHIIGEIINGRIESHPRPAPKHALASSSLGGELFFHFNREKEGLEAGGILMNQNSIWILMF